MLDLPQERKLKKVILLVVVKFTQMTVLQHEGVISLAESKKTEVENRDAPHKRFSVVSEFSSFSYVQLDKVKTVILWIRKSFWFTV